MDVLVVAPREQIEDATKEPTAILEASPLVCHAETLFRFESDRVGDFWAKTRKPIVVIDGDPGEYNTGHIPAPVVLAKLRDPLGLVAVWGRSPQTGKRSPWVAHAITAVHRRRGEVEVYAPGNTNCISRFELLNKAFEPVASLCTTQGQAAARDLAKQHPDAVALRVAIIFDDHERHYTPPLALAPAAATPPQTPTTPASAAPQMRPRTRPKHSTPNPDELPQHLAPQANAPTTDAQKTQQEPARPLTARRNLPHVCVVSDAWPIAPDFTTL